MRLVRWLGLLGAAAMAVVSSHAQRPRPPLDVPATAPRAGAETQKLDPVQVRARAEDAGYDATGLGAYENQFRDPPFWNELISVESMEDDPVALELGSEMQQIASPSAVDLATGDARLALRGFPTPVLRNGFVTLGAPDMLNTSRTVTIQGALVPVLGRAAPGGIQDFITWRPRTTAGKRLSYSISSLRRQTALFEVTGPAVAKKAWQRVAGDWSRRTGPEAYAASETRSMNAALTVRHSAAASTLVGVDFQQVHATPAPSIPEFRRSNGAKIVGPYLPLAGFNSAGPEAGVRRRTAAATVHFDAQPTRYLALRAGFEAWWRGIEQDRFTTSLYNVAAGRFEGIREPRHVEQPQRVQLAHLELTRRFRAWRTDHKLLAAASQTWGVYEREERALSFANRNSLPAGVRNFDPDTPDYSRPRFSRAVYDRVLADRREKARYTAVEVSHRMAPRQGRLVITSGVRHDLVNVRIEDRTPGARVPRVDDTVGQVTYHSGLNYQALPGRLLLFATGSTAFEPSSRVDARTGRLQPNEMTRGYEAGAKLRLAQPLLELSIAGFSLINEDISRRNPLYDDPIFDANHTQPQLVASGEETFRGFKFEGRWKPAVPWSVTGRLAYAQAITTASPDLPEEVGRAITRLPPWNGGVSVSYTFGKGRFTGLSVSGSWSGLSGYVAQYEDAQRHRLAFGGYGQMGGGVNYSRRVGKQTHALGLSIRNAMDYNFVVHQARLGSGRELTVTYRLTF